MFGARLCTLSIWDSCFWRLPDNRSARSNKDDLHGDLHGSNAWPLGIKMRSMEVDMLADYQCFYRVPKSKVFFFGGQGRKAVKHPKESDCFVIPGCFFVVFVWLYCGLALGMVKTLDAVESQSICWGKKFSRSQLAALFMLVLGCLVLL